MKYPSVKLALSGGLVILAVLVFLLIGSCGKGKSASSLLAPQESVRGFPSQETEGRKLPSLDEVLAELDALPAPEGVDESVFSALKSALREALQNTWTTGVPPVGTGETFTRRGEPVLQTEEKKLVSAPPTGEANRVNDLELVDNGDGTYALTWSYKNLGDYNQDGIVNIMDITPLAVHLGEPEGDPNSITEMIDEDDEPVLRYA